MSDIHSVAFLTKNHKWTVDKARRWLSKHNLKPIKPVHKVVSKGVITQLRFRIRDPRFFRGFITKKNDDDINIIIGFY